MDIAKPADSVSASMSIGDEGTDRMDTEFKAYPPSAFKG